MMASASAASLPGMGTSSSFSCQSLGPQPATPTGQQPPFTATDQPPPQSTADSNNNHNKNSTRFPGSSAAEATCRKPEEESPRADLGQRRAASFKRAVRLQPVCSQDLTDLSDLMPDDDPALEGGGSRVKAEEAPAAGSDRPHAPRDQRQQAGPRAGGGAGRSARSGPSDGDDSSDAERGERPLRRRRGGKPSELAAMYSSMPVLNGLERKPAQKRRAGETKSGLRTKKDLSKSSDGLGGRDSEGAGPPSSGRYRRAWEGAGNGLQQKVPALHDTYSRRSRETMLLRKIGRASSGATLTDWGSVDKLTHGSLSDLSHLEEDPWVKNDSLSQPASSPRAGDSPARSTPTPAPTRGTHTRSHSLSLTPGRDGSPGTYTPGPGRPRNNSDVTEIMRRAGKENLDWMVYVNRNSGDLDIRERADSLGKPGGRPRPASGEAAIKALRECNSNISARDCNLSRSVTLCQDTLKRYSLDMPDKAKVSGGDDVSSTSPRRMASEDVLTTSADKPETPSSSGTTLMSVSADVQMTDVTGTASQPPQATFRASGNGVDTADSPPTPKPRSNVHQLLSPTPFSSTLLSPSPFFPASFCPRLKDEPEVTPTTRSEPSQVPPTTSYQSSQSGHSPVLLPADPPPTPAHPPPIPAHPPPSPRRSAHRPASPQTAALSAEGERMVAEMEKYYKANSPTATLASKFPSSADASHDQSWQQTTGEASSAGIEQDTSTSTNNAGISQDSSTQDNYASVNRFSGVSSVSSSSNDGSAGHYHHHHLHPPRDVNPNRLSGTSSISTSSYESQNSSSSDSLVGALKSKLSVWTLKLGGRRSREEEWSDHRAVSASRDSLTSPTPLLAQAELQHVLREHSLGSPLIGSRMANTLPVGFEPLLSPSATTKDQALSSCDYSGGEGSRQPQSRFSFPSAMLQQSRTAAEALAASGPVRPSDSGISLLSAEFCNARGFQRGASTLPTSLDCHQCLEDGENLDPNRRQRRDSDSSTSSGDSFYERRLSVAFESGMFQEQPAGPQSPECRQGPRRSIREVVQYIEEKFRPRQPAPVEVKRKEPSALIRQRLQSLRDNASYKRRLSSRSQSEDRSRGRDITPDSPRLARPEQRSRSANQFMHRVQVEHVARGDTREAQHALERERESAAKRVREMAAGREREMAGRVFERGQESEERSEGGGSSGVSAMGSMERLDQQSSEVDNLLIMRGWVRNLINKFQQIT